MRRNINAEDYKSKSQLKREAQAIHEIGEAMIGLKENNLKKLPLPEYILDAVLAAQSMKQGALKRQVQYIGRLMREDDELDLAALQRALAAYLK